MMDLVYFGYDYEEGSRQDEMEFIKMISKKFSSVKLINAYDSIKGYRQEVHLPDNLENDYYAWMIGDGWFNSSLTLQIMMMNAEKRDEFYKLFELAKKRYPENFKAKTLKEKIIKIKRIIYNKIMAIWSNGMTPLS